MQHLLQQQQINANANAPANLNNPQMFAHEVKISGTAMLHELMTRNGFYLPNLKSRYCT
jgi:hypothetical protein